MPAMFDRDGAEAISSPAADTHRLALFR
jgi:hypothetical protein